MEAKLSTKLPTGKWWTWGSIKKNQWGNLQASFKVTPELVALFQEKQGSWINFSVFEEKQPDTAKADGYAPQQLDDDLPF